MRLSAPRSRDLHSFETHGQRHLFVVDGSQLFDADEALFSRVEAALACEDTGILGSLGFSGPARIDDTPLAPVPVHALSLAVAQKCNLGCSYCYAEQGRFGGPAQNMARETAFQAVELLVTGAEPGARLNLAFMGGEPLVNRDVLRETTRHAASFAEQHQRTIGFSITTNGTLLTASDAEFFEEFGFAVSVSIDGPRDVHDRLRPFADGRGSFDRIMHNVRPLLALQRRMQVSARVTVTPRNLGLRETLDELVAAGFHSVGFAPMLAAPSGTDEMHEQSFEVMLGELIDCGHEFERRSAAGRRYPFANLLNALKEIERGTHRPYPCGAGAGYLGLAADGELAACHRFVGDEAGKMGSLREGIDGAARAEWLAERHVHRQEPCSGCWARYLCGGGCHHEVLRRGRPACNFIRGWLQYCLEAYLRLSSRGAAAARPLQASV